MWVQTPTPSTNKNNIMDFQYWHHAESESVGILTESEIEEYSKTGTLGSEPLDLISEDEYLRLAVKYGIDTRRDHNNFHENLEYIQRGEEEVAKLLTRKLKSFNITNFNDDKDYDIVGTFRGREVTVEVKEDFRVNDTGNVVVETRSRGKPSGLATTKADFWVFRLHLADGISHYLIKPGKMKDRIKKGGIRSRQMTHTDSCNKLWFFTVEQIVEMSDMKLDT